MKKSVFAMALMMTTGLVSLQASALSIDPGSVHLVEGNIYRGGVNIKKGVYGQPITDYQYVCDNGFQVVVNAYSSAPAKQITCPPRSAIPSFTYVGSKWNATASPNDSVAVDAVRRQEKVLVHCVNGVDASQEVAYIIAAKAGHMSAQQAANAFAHAPAGTPHGPMLKYILARGK